MSRRKSGGGRTTPKRTRPRNWDASVHGGGVDDWRGRIPPPRPTRRPPIWELLQAVSMQLADLMPTHQGLGIPDRSGLEREVELELGGEPKLAPTLAIVAELLDNDRLRQLADQHLATLGFEATAPAKAIVDELTGAVAVDPFETREPFDEARHLSFGVRFPCGDELSVLVLVEHAGGMLLQDAFVVGKAVNEIRRATGREPDLTITDASAAEIRRLLDDAIDGAHRTLPPPVTDTWPDDAVLIEWAVRKLPDPVPPIDWEPMADADQEAFIEEFVASEERKAIKRADSTVIDAVSTLLWFKDGYTNGDVYRWGPKQVEMLLGDWALRKVIGDDAGLRAYPAVLRGLIPWCHRRIGLEARHTEATLEAVDDMEPFFLAELHPGRLKGIDALMAHAAPFLSGAGGDDDGEFGDFGEFGRFGRFGAAGQLGHVPGCDCDDHELDEWWAKRQARRRVEAVGGLEELKGLTGQPLPGNEMPSFERIGPDLRPLVSEVAAEAMRVADALYGAEYGTAAARLTVRLAEADSKALTRGRPESAVAALVWMIGSANGRRWSTYLVDIQELAGTKSSPKERARTFARALGVEYTDTEDLLLGSADLLVSARRLELIEEEAEDPGRH